MISEVFRTEGIAFAQPTVQVGDDGRHSGAVAAAARYPSSILMGRDGSVMHQQSGVEDDLAVGARIAMALSVRMPGPASRSTVQDDGGYAAGLCEVLRERHSNHHRRSGWRLRQQVTKDSQAPLQFLDGTRST